jgi:ABC-2 type transport system ATP-binding protein
MPESPIAEWALATQGLHRRFGRRAVIRGLDLRVPPGVVYGFLGRNGAGKTTTIRMLMGMLPPDQGELTVGGLTGRRVTAAARTQVGYVSQEQHFYEWMTVRELGRFVGGFYPTWREDVLNGLLARLHIEPKQPVGELSGGTKMKLAMALALAHQPKTLILDEPTAGVDPIARREILELLKAQAVEAGRTVFFSTHHISEVEEVGDWVGILHDGRMLYQGPVTDLARWIRKVDVAPEGPFKVLLTQKDGLVVLGRPADWERAPVEHRPVSLDEAFYAVAREVG